MRGSLLKNWNGCFCHSAQAQLCPSPQAYLCEKPQAELSTSSKRHSAAQASAICRALGVECVRPNHGRTRVPSSSLTSPRCTFRECDFTSPSFSLPRPC